MPRASSGRPLSSTAVSSRANGARSSSTQCESPRRTSHPDGTSPVRRSQERHLPRPLIEDRVHDSLRAEERAGGAGAGVRTADPGAVIVESPDHGVVVRREGDGAGPFVVDGERRQSPKPEHLRGGAHRDQPRRTVERHLMQSIGECRSRRQTRSRADGTRRTDPRRPARRPSLEDVLVRTPPGCDGDG